MAMIDPFKFDNASIEAIKKLRHFGTNVGENWPVVYLINNSSEMYIGETVDVARRISQHLLNPERKKLKSTHIISDKDYNKSAVLDLESFLIKYMSSDGKFKLQNGNGGISDHDYYDRARYEENFRDVWNKLFKLGLVQHSLEEIENSDIFKYSPYKALTSDQKDALYSILQLLQKARASGEESSILVEGGAGTGKTVLAIFLMKMLSEFNAQQAAPASGKAAPAAKKKGKKKTALSSAGEQSAQIALPLTGDSTAQIALPLAADLPAQAARPLTADLAAQTALPFEDEGDNEEASDEARMVRAIGPLRFALVVPMQSLRKTIKKVFKTVKGLSPNMVISPMEVPGNQYDLLIVDESHRLRQRKALSQYPTFDERNAMFGLGKEGTELDWILRSSQTQLFFYDPDQSVKPSDIDYADFQAKIHSHTLLRMTLTSQLRCKGGQDYIEYIKKLIGEKPPENKKHFEDYELTVFDDVEEMVQAIKQKDREWGLSRVIAGYAWDWETKKPLESRKKNYDIEIDGNRYIWNTTAVDWVNSKNAINEIGCIHTVQGYDLNYCGVIFGKEIRYDPVTDRLEVDMKNYKDRPGKTALKDQESLRQYIFHIYQTMLTRGIRGTYVYACDEGLREYIKKFVDEAK